MCCTRRFASCLGPRIYRLLIPRNRGGPLMCGVYLKVKCSNGGPENYTNCWFCKYPVTSHVGTFLDRAVASLWLRRVSTLWQLLRKRRHRRDIGHVGYSVRHLISPIQIHSVRSLHSLWYLSFIACWTQQGILNFQLNFLNLPMVAGEKKTFCGLFKKGQTCYSCTDHTITARLHLAWTLWLGSQDRWSQPSQLLGEC